MLLKLLSASVRPCSGRTGLRTALSPWRLESWEPTSGLEPGESFIRSKTEVLPHLRRTLRPTSEGRGENDPRCTLRTADDVATSRSASSGAGRNSGFEG